MSADTSSLEFVKSQLEQEIELACNRYLFYNDSATRNQIKQSIHTLMKDLNKQRKYYIMSPDTGFTDTLISVDCDFVSKFVERIIKQGYKIVRLSDDTIFHSYQVVCDDSNNSLGDMENKQLNISLHIQPGRSINQTIINAKVQL